MQTDYQAVANWVDFYVGGALFKQVKVSSFPPYAYGMTATVNGTDFLVNSTKIEMIDVSGPPLDVRNAVEVRLSVYLQSPIGAYEASSNRVEATGNPDSLPVSVPGLTGRK